MNEADLTEQLLQITELLFTGTSVVFTIISAYIVGLYWFLHKTSWFMRLIVFSMFTMMMAILMVAGFGAFRHSEGITLALIELSKTEQLSPLGLMAIENTAQGVSDVVTTGSVIIAASLYAALFYLNFFYRWDEKV